MGALHDRPLPADDEEEVEVEVEFDLSEADPSYEDEPIDWDDLDLEEPEEPIAPFVKATTSWGELDMAALLKGDLDEDPPSVLPRADGPHLLYRGKVSSVAGEPESGKGWFAMLACEGVFREGGHVLYIDFEDGPKGVVNRLRSLGVPDTLIARQFHYIRPELPLSLKASPTGVDLLSTLKRVVESDGGLGLIVFDGITEALAMQSIESKDNDLVSRWFADIPRRFAHVTKAAVLLIDHVTKATDSRGRFAIGASAKLAAIDGTQFTAEVKLAFARGRSGLVRINVTKDRPGYVRAIASGNGHTQAVADLIVTAREEGQLRLALVEPDLKTAPDGSVNPTNLEGQIITYMKKLRTYRGREHILSGVKGRSQTKRAAFNALLDEQFITEFKQGRQTLFRISNPDEVRNGA